MAGRIRDEDVALVRERSAIDEVAGEYLQLRSAGGGSLMALCPFHEEKTPSFSVTPSRGLWYCFSCHEGGDVITFVRKIDGLGFAEAVERLAARLGIDLHYEQGGAVPGQERSRRRRYLEAHHEAAVFYSERLQAADAAPAREFLAARGFEPGDAALFGVGYSPAEWDALTRHLRGRGFTDAELVGAGLAREGRRGTVDRFRGRLMWPIRDIAGDVIAFGARKLTEDDDGPKYLNTPETPLFKKSSVLYGADLAKRDIAQRRQAVIVEGYTDVMACHLAGVTTAVATCGTSFGDGHVRILRRLLMDADWLRGDVIFTFDGDAAGQRAALRAFGMEEKFVTQTFVAVQPDGLDPCDLRLARGDAAVRDLIAQRVPLYEFAIRSAIAAHDTETAEGQLAGLDAAADVIGRIKDYGLRKVYAGKLDRWLGLNDERFVLRRIDERIRSRGARRLPAVEGAGRPAAGHGGNGGPAVAGGDSLAARAAGAPGGYDVRDPVIQVEREALKLAIQRPALCGPGFDALGPAHFTAPAHATVAGIIAGCGGARTARDGRQWAQALRIAAPDDGIRNLITELAVEALRVPRRDGEADADYADAVLARVEELSISREIAAVKSRLQRLSPVAGQPEYNRTFGQLVALEQRRKTLLDRAGAAL
jgi:DNA primase